MSSGAEAEFLQDFLLPLTRNIRGGGNLDLADVALRYERQAESRLAELRGAIPFPAQRLAAARRDPAETGQPPGGQH